MSFYTISIETKFIKKKGMNRYEMMRRNMFIQSKQFIRNLKIVVGRVL